ncbi:Flp family type IVb pilin [Schinkia sp. CFF1]
MMNKMKNFIKEEEGQGMTEYGLIIGLVAIIAAVGLTSMGSTLKAKFDSIVSSLTGNSTQSNQ